MQAAEMPASARRGSRGTVRTWTVMVLALTMSVLASPATAQEHDPTEPDRPLSDFAAYPSSSVSLSPGTTFAVSAVDRVSGANRYGTAVAASQVGWPHGADNVVIASGDEWQDALSASSLAGALYAPLLLSTAQGLDEATLAEIQRLSPSSISLVGALPATVADQVADLAAQVDVVAGPNVHETSLEASLAAIEAGADNGTVIVASALSFADSLTASALASGLDHPLILVGGVDNAEWLGHVFNRLEATQTLVVGGTAIVPDGVLTEVDNVARLSGSNRYETALAVARHARVVGMDGPPILVSGSTFADGLAGGVLAGNSHRGPLLLAAPADLGETTAAWLAADGATWVRIVGGNAAVSQLASCQLGAADTRAWLCVEQEMAEQGYHAGVIDGVIDAQAVWMSYALQKVTGLRVDGDFGDAEYDAMLRRVRLQPRRPDLEPNHVEIDIGRQLILVVRNGEVVHQLHTSSGKSSTPTVIGTYRVYERRNYRQANRMYRPVFFHRGYAFHGYPEVPLYPASAGCARMYDGDMDFLWNYLYMGEQITTYR